MSPAQRTSFYFPAWRKCAKANDWVMERNRLVADLDAQHQVTVGSPAFTERVRIIDYATALAIQGHHAVTADDLRHACNWLASGGATIHTEDMTNRATTLAVRLFHLLSDPDNLTFVGDWIHPEEADRRDYADWLGRTVPEAVLIAISRNTWQTPDWRSQGIDQLRWLARTAMESQHRRQGTFRRTIERNPF